MLRRLACIVLVALVACQQQPPASHTMIRDSAGVQVLEVAASTLLERIPERLQVSSFLTLPPEFGDVADVQLSAGGYLVVLDPLEPGVIVVDSSGAEVSRFGRDGTGPGEFRGTGLSNIVVLGDSIFVPDLVNQRMTVFTLGGDLVRTFALDLQDGRTLDWHAMPGGGLVFRRRSDPQRIEHLFGEQVHVLADLESLDLPAAPGPLAPVPLWCVFPDGRLAIGRADQYRVLVLDASRVVGILRTDQPPALLPEEGIEHVQDLMLESLDRIPAEQVSPELVERMLSGVIFPENSPQIAGLACPKDDELWVQRAVPVTEMGPDVLRVGSARAFGGATWDVWDLVTGVIRSVTVTSDARITHISDSVVVGFSIDAMGIKTLARWRRH